LKLSTKIFNAIHQVLNSTIFTKTELQQPGTVAYYLDSAKEPEAADWIRANHVDYLVGLLEGFEVDNDQEQQLKDIHTDSAESLKRG